VAAAAAARRLLVIHGKGCEARGLTPEMIAGWGTATMVRARHQLALWTLERASSR
jgi:hypothetical protein